VGLAKAEPTGGELVVEVASDDPGPFTIEMIENARIVETIRGSSARRAVPAQGYVRATVTRADGAQAWTQPARR
jgi:hypothetical protein